MRSLTLRLTSLAILLVLCASSPGAWAQSPRPAPPSGFLRVQGREIVAGNGRPVYLRGVNMHTNYYSYAWDPNAPWDYATQQDIRYLARLGATAIRLGFHWRYFDSSLGFDLLDSYLDWCEQAGIYVILDMHVVPPDEDILQGGIWDDPAAQQRFLDLWTAIAARYAGRAIVAGYDLYNEPAPPDAAQWWALAERAGAAIRAVDANHILFIENPLLEDDAFSLLTDPNVVYSFHEYRPFAVSHAGAEWVGDVPVPTSYSYPGSVLVDVEWLASAEDAAEFSGKSKGWISWDSGALTVPAGAEFAGLTPFVWGNAGSVWFDELKLFRNGKRQKLFNPGLESASWQRENMPAGWFFWSESGFTGVWSSTRPYRGKRSLQINSDGDGYGEWGQANWILTAPLLAVRPGDTLQVRGWLRAPKNKGGAGLGMNYLKGVYVDYNRARLQADMQPYLDWAAANNVPLFVGEFGAISGTPGNSRHNLVGDTISVMNQAGLHWSLWAYRDGEPPTFGLYLGDELDEGLAEILRQGFGAASARLDLHRQPD